MGLLTQAEIIGNAFTRDMETTKIKDEMIDAVQQRHIMPIVGEDFYDLIVTTPASYTAIVDLIKPIVAYFVKFYILPELHAEISTTGVNIITGQNRAAVSDGKLGELRNLALDTAQMHVKRLSKHLDDNSDSYPDYFKGKNADEKIKIAGGIIFEDPKMGEDEEDDYTINLKYY